MICKYFVSFDVQFSHCYSDFEKLKKIKKIESIIYYLGEN